MKKFLLKIFILTVMIILYFFWGGLYSVMKVIATILDLDDNNSFYRLLHKLETILLDVLDKSYEVIYGH